MLSHVVMGARAGLRVSQDMRQDDVSGGDAVGGHLIRKAAIAVEKSLHQGVGVVEAARTRPAVGARENGGVSVEGLHPPDLLGDQIEGALPGDGDERIGPASVRPLSRPVLEPAGAHHRPADAALVIYGGLNRLQDGGGRRVLGKRLEAHHAPVPHVRPKGPPSGSCGGVSPLRLPPRGSSLKGFLRSANARPGYRAAWGPSPEYSTTRGCVVPPCPDAAVPRGRRRGDFRDGMCQGSAQDEGFTSASLWRVRISGRMRTWITSWMRVFLSA